MKPILVLACLLPVFAVHSQGRRAAEAQALEAQLEAAQAEGTANAVRPGDESLTCDQLQAEIATVAQSSEIQAGLAPFAEQAQADQAQVAEAQQQVEQQTPTPQRGGGLFRSLAQGAASAALPNSVAASAQTAAAAAQAAQMRGQAEQRQQQIFGQGQQMAAMMGPAMRGQRLIELAEAKKCAWLNGDSLSAADKRG
jgi:hypothetical protein